MTAINFYRFRAHKGQSATLVKRSSADLVYLQKAWYWRIACCFKDKELVDGVLIGFPKEMLDFKGA